VRVATVTTSDRSLLHAVRSTLTGAEEALLCVAFVQEKGIHLLEKELESLHRRRAPARLLVTTTFKTTSMPALGMARKLGLAVRVLNPGSGSTFHPKLYLGRTGRSASAVIGSANLTGGLATNLEVGVALEGRRDDQPIARAWEWAESLWDHRRVEPWQPEATAEPEPEVIEPALLAAISAEWRRDPLFRTLRRGSRDLVTDVTPGAVYVETDSTRKKGTGPRPVEAWMLNLAWDHLRTHGRLTNAELLDDLRVHRSSAVCALLARVPGVRVKGTGPITLEWVQPEAK